MKVVYSVCECVEALRGITKVLLLYYIRHLWIQFFFTNTFFLVQNIMYPVHSGIDENVVFGTSAFVRCEFGTL